MPSGPVPPIVVCDDGDISFYARVHDAEQELEGIDVLRGVYEVFDSHGNQLSATSEGDVVHIEMSSGSSPP